jgi:hypothetical protein
VTCILSLAACQWRHVSGGMSVAACQWRHVSGGMSVAACQWRHVSGGMSVAACQWRHVSGPWRHVSDTSGTVTTCQCACHGGPSWPMPFTAAASVTSESAAAAVAGDS